METSALYGSLQDFGYWKEAPSPVPVPAALWLMGAGLIGLYRAARKKI